MTKDQFLTMCMWLTTRTQVIIEMHKPDQLPGFGELCTDVIARLDADAYRVLVAETDKKD